jgi:hypothetical protein
MTSRTGNENFVVIFERLVIFVETSSLYTLSNDI